LPAAVATGTNDGSVCCFTKTLTGGAQLASIDLQFGCHALHCLFKRNGDGALQIAAPRRPSRRGLRPNVAKDLREYVAEVCGSEVCEVKNRPARTRIGCLIGIVAIAIVDLAFFRIRENLKRFGDLLKSIF
jgi:hypothetical protein